MRRWPTGDEGSFTLEQILCAIPLFIFGGLLAAFGMTVVNDGAVDNAARAAARAASQSPDAATAQVRGEQAALAALRQEDRECTDHQVSIDTSGFATEVGQPASVTATVRCTVALSQLAVPGLPGSKTLDATFTSPLDTFAERG